MALDPDLLKRIIEGALLAAGDALSIDRLKGLFEEHESPEKAEIQAALEALQVETEGRAYALIEVASGWRFQVRADLAPWINRLWEEKPQRYSRALLETLALIAYRQPLTRSDIEDVRGVAVSSHIIKTLAEREWIKVVGHRDVPGRPSLYATTRQFLDYFGLKSLDELPTLSELKDFDDLNRDLNLDSDPEPGQIAEAQDSQEAQEPSEEGADDAERGNEEYREADLFDQEANSEVISLNLAPVEQASAELVPADASTAEQPNADRPAGAQEFEAGSELGANDGETDVDTDAEESVSPQGSADTLQPEHTEEVSPDATTGAPEKTNQASFAEQGHSPTAANDTTTKTPPSDH